MAVRFAATLAAGHLAMSGLFVALLYQIGTVTAGHLPRDVALGTCVVAAVAAIGVDARAVRDNGYSLGFQRQTSKSLMHDEGRPWWVTPLFWGLDTGLIGSTFRVSCTSWVLLLAALLNVAPQWSGLVYGFCFAIPLVVSIVAGNGEGFGYKGSQPPLRMAQSAGLAILGTLPIGVLWGLSAIG